MEEIKHVEKDKQNISSVMKPAEMAEKEDKIKMIGPKICGLNEGDA